jgi:hypothetical protein
VIATNVGGNPEYLNLVGLVNYIVEVKQYDFSSILTSKLLKALTNDKKLEESIVNNVIPSWSDISRRYLYLLEKI